jgi:hypothetical protein
MVQISISALCDLFLHWVIFFYFCDVLWAPLSAEVTASDYFNWGYLKGTVCGQLANID